MEPNKQDIVSQDDTHAQKLPDLSTKQKDFIEKLLKTGNTFDSYLSAGYIGNYKASYELRRRLLPWIQELSGCSPADVFRQVRNLAEMRITDGTVTFADKLKLLKFQAKLAGLERDNMDAKTNHFTQFVINHSDKDSNKSDNKNDVPATSVLDTDIVKQSGNNQSNDQGGNKESE